MCGRYGRRSDKQNIAEHYAMRRNVDVLGGRIELDYSDGKRTFFGILNSDARPLLDI
jgi:hypothetical protein